MHTAAPIEAHIAVVPLPNLGPDAYANEKPLTSEGARSIFGGLLVAQAVSAASATVPDVFRLYSLQSSFLAPANGREDVVYRVDRTADGRVYSARIVRAVQGESCVYVATVSFHNVNESVGRVLRYGPPMLDLDGAVPDDVDRSDASLVVWHAGYVGAIHVAGRRG